MAKTKITSRAKHPDKTERFIMTVQMAIDIFDDEIGSLMQDTRLKAYRNLVRSYKTALTSVWDQAWFANVKLVLESVEDKQMRELAVMTQKLKPPDPETQVVKEAREVPTSESLMNFLSACYPDKPLPNTTVCKRIGGILTKLGEANKAFGEAAEALGEIATELSPEQYTLLLAATAAPTIHVVVPPNMTSPIAPPAPPPS